MASLTPGGALTWPDYAVLLGALGCLLAIGGAFTREQRDTADFFLARRRIPWWAACLSFLASQIDGGLGAMFRTAATAGRLNVINWGPAPGDPGFWHRVLTDPSIFWLAILNGFVGSMAAFGTDHDLMQRLLTVETRRASQRTLSLTPVGTLVTLLIYLTIGAGLFTYYAQHPAGSLPRPDEIFPFFIRSAMPEVLRGVMLAAIVLASIDSPLGSLAASFVTDIYRPLLARNRTERHYLRVSRGAVVAFGLVLAALAYGFSFFDRFLWLAFKIAGVTFGSLLGVFLLGLLTSLRANRANVAAMVSMAVLNFLLLVLAETGIMPLGWSWLVIFGTVGTMGLSAILAPLLDRRPARGLTS